MLYMALERASVIPLWQIVRGNFSRRKGFASSNNFHGKDYSGDYLAITRCNRGLRDLRRHQQMRTYEQSV